MAAHLAHRGLLDGEAGASVAGGTNVMLDAATMAGICQLQVGFLCLTCSQHNHTLVCTHSVDPNPALLRKLSFAPAGTITCGPLQIV